MNDNSTTLFIEQEVWWSDPEEKTSGVYKVLDIKTEPDGGLYDDTIVLISNGYSEAEVSAGELQDLKHRRKCISDFVDKVTKIAEEDDWSVYNYDKAFDRVSLEFGKYSSRDQDFSFSINCKTGSVDEFIEAIEDYYDDYDPSEEASIWLDPNGHGKNGAPHDLEDVLNDMKECKENVRSLLDCYKEKLLGDKKPATHPQYTVRLCKFRNELVESIHKTLKNILKKTNTYSLLWHTITNGNDPDICYESDSGACSVLPTLISLGENEADFGIIFASYCDCPSSINGENLYTETLIEILEYLENYRSTL